MVIYYALWYFVDVTWSWFEIVLTIIYCAITVNVGLGVFNLIPIPPLDGSKVFRRFLPYNANNWIDRNMQIIYIVFMVLWITNLLDIIVTPILKLILSGLNLLVANIFNLFL
ncbi:MAG: hypothetical protein HFJ45_00250 [Clostridia bacterium]|nr:hypothetical protein [Clostridia bacterium]